MRGPCIACVIAAVLAFPVAASAKTKSSSGDQMGQIRDDCRAQYKGQRGVSKQAMIKSCVQRQKGKN